MDRETEKNQQVADFWADVAEREELGFWCAPGWKEHQNRLASGDPDRSWLQVFHEEMRLQGKEPGHARSIGCGSGLLEREMIEEGLCTSVEGCDLSEPLLAIAEEKAAQQRMPITYFIADLNTHDFPKNHYDLIIGAGIFHHVDALERLFGELKESLKVGGVLLLYDYVGPSRFQWSEKQIARCNAWLNRLPKKYKKKQGYPYYYYVGKTLFDLIPFSSSTFLERAVEKLASRRLFSQFVRIKTAQTTMKTLIPPHPAQFFVTDPSEAIRSSDILPALQEHFVIEKFLSLGGTLAQPLFGRTVANFLHDQEGQKWAALILEDERIAIQNNELESDFIALMAKKK